MSVKDLILKEFVKNGYSKRNRSRVWCIDNPHLLFLTEELATGFLNLGKFSVYKSHVINCELSLIKSNADKIRKLTGEKPCNLIDMRCSDGERAHFFLKSLEAKHLKIRYCPIGMHPSLGKKAISRIKKAHFKNIVGYRSEVSNFENIFNIPSALRSHTFQKNILFLMGSTISLVEINDFLFKIANTMFKGDLLIIGNGIRSGPRLVNIKTYQHHSFNSWFMPLLKNIGFSEKEVHYDARFGNKRIECFYTLLTDKTLRYKGKSLTFKKGDEIRVAVIYKYYERELRRFCKMYFSKVDILRKDDEYVLIMCQK